MNYQFYFKKMKTSEALIDYAKRKLSKKIEQLSAKHDVVSITFFKDETNNISCCRLNSGNANLGTEFSSKNMYCAVDKLAQKLKELLRRNKEKKTSRKLKANSSFDTELPKLLAKASSSIRDDEPLDASYIIAEETMRKRQAELNH